MKCPARGAESDVWRRPRGPSGGERDADGGSVISAADSATAKLRRVTGGHEVAIITLPSDHRILVDAIDASADRYLCVRLNEHGAFCWKRECRESQIKGWLHDADGDIRTANTRGGCKGWPSRYAHISVGGADA